MFDWIGARSLGSVFKSAWREGIIVQSEEMQKTKTPPKKPLTPFFLFREKEKDKGHTMGGKEAGALWAALSDSGKKPYLEEYKKAKEAYDKYLEETIGIPHRSSSKKAEKPTSFNSARIRAICGKKKSTKEMPHLIYKALGRVLVGDGKDLLGSVYV